MTGALLPDLRFSRNAFLRVYPMRKIDGGLTLILVQAQTERAEFVFRKHEYALTSLPGRAVILDLLPNGEPRLIQTTGEVVFDGRGVARSLDGEAFVLAAPKGESLLSTWRADLWADDPLQVETDAHLDKPFDEGVAVLIDTPPDFQDAAEKLKRTLEERGIHTHLRGGMMPMMHRAGVIVRAALATNPRRAVTVMRRDGVWPELRLGTERLWQPWSAAIVITPAREATRVTVIAPDEAGVRAGLLRVGHLRQLKPCAVGPYARIDWLLREQTTNAPRVRNFR